MAIVYELISDYLIIMRPDQHKKKKNHEYKKKHGLKSGKQQSEETARGSSRSNQEKSVQYATAKDKENVIQTENILHAAGKVDFLNSLYVANHYDKYQNIVCS